MNGRALKTWLHRIWEHRFPGRKRPAVPSSPCLFLRLGLWEDATADEIRSAYEEARRKAPNPAAVRLLEEAHTVLSDPARREITLLIRKGLAAAGLGTGVETRPRPRLRRLRVRKRWILLLAVLAAAAAMK